LYFWNSGIYCVKARFLVSLIESRVPSLKTLWNKHNRNIDLIYKKIEHQISLEYAILQSLNRLICFNLHCGWDDIGVWHAFEVIAKELGVDYKENTKLQGEILPYESYGNIVDSEDNFIALLGVNNLIIVQSKGAILIADKKRSQDIKKLLDEIKKRRPDLI
jgi:mannose-1-phosphate guanylyltransferase